ncbi:DUF445 family protein [bacterium]|nr:DUF445 family protein [bacterium]
MIVMIDNKTILTKLFIPIIGAFIGWITNVIAIWLLFRPYKRRFGIQGLLPKYQNDIAERLGKLLKQHLLDDETLINSIDLDEKITEFLDRKIETLNPFVKMVLKDLIGVNTISNFIKNNLQLEEELRKLPEMIQVDTIVSDKIKQFDLRQLETLVYGATSREIRFIKLTGAVLGFLIGLIQILLIKIL